MHNLSEIGTILDFESSATGLESLRLLETLIVGAEDDGHIPYGSLQRVVDAYTKTASHIGDIGISVDAGEQAEAVDNESRPSSPPLPRWEGSRMFVGGEAGIAADAKAFQHFLYLLQMILADDMGSNDELPVAMLVEVFGENLFIRLPR